MILIVQENWKVYINKERVETLTFDERAKEARVLYTSGKEVKYLHVSSVDFK